MPWVVGIFAFIMIEGAEGSKVIDPTLVFIAGVVLMAVAVLADAIGES